MSKTSPPFDIDDPPTADDGQLAADSGSTMPFLQTSQVKPGQSVAPAPSFGPPPGQAPSPPPASPWAPAAIPFSSSQTTLERSRGSTAAPHAAVAPQTGYARVAGTPFTAPAPSPPPAPRHDSKAAFGGIGAASDAAVQVTARSAVEQPKPIATPRAQSNEYLDLVWFDSSAPERIREQTAWAEFLRDPPKTNDWVTGDEADRKDDRGRAERDVRRALARVGTVAPDAIHLLVTEAIDDDGVLVRPLCVVGGDLVLAFDPLENLRATIDAASHFAGGDKKLKDVVDAAAAAIAEEKRIAPALIESFSSRIRQTFNSAPRGVAHDYLDTAVERVLLDERKYARRNVLGGPHIVAELYGETGAPMPTYLGANLADTLPLFRRFRVRLLAEPHPPQDPTDAGHVALKALALSRVVPRRRSG